jgi:CRP-like cAMP-binding protein
MVPGEYFGEMALLTGEKRSATVRARDYPTLVQLSSEHIRPFIEARSEILEAMSETAAARAERRVSGSDAISRKEMARRMRAHLFYEQASGDEIVVQESVLELLQRLPLLSPLSREEIAALAERAECRTVAGGTVIVRQGTRGSSLFAVLAGRVGVYHVQRGRRRRIGTIPEGEVFGEMALMTGERRSADVQADGDCTVVEISRSDFLPVLTRRPSLVVALSEILDRRAAERQASGVAASLHGLPAASGDRQGLRRRVRSFFFG